MQKRPKISYPVKYTDYELDPAFPIIIVNHGFDMISDFPITELDSHDYMEIAFCHQGSGIFIVNNKVMSFSAGDAIIIFEKQFHMATSDSGSMSTWHYIIFEPVKLLVHAAPESLTLLKHIAKGNNSFSNILTAAHHPDLIKLISEIDQELSEQKANYEYVIRGLVWAFMVKLWRYISADAQDEHISAEDHNLACIAPALNHIINNYMYDISVNELAELCRLNVRTFRRLFASHMNCSPMEYLYNIRIQIASNMLLNTDLPILEISSSVGYNSLSSFNRHFKRIVRLSPREMKKNNGK